MRYLCGTIAALSLLQVAAARQTTTADAIAELRAQVLDRVHNQGVPKEPLSRAFGLPDDMRLVRAAQLAFPGRHDLAVVFATGSTDVFLTESRNGPDGPVVTVFHTDLTLGLRAAASGADITSLHIVAAGDVSSRFQDVLMTWNDHLPSLLARMRQKVPRQ